jgi:uncharacterized alkaline shock family protein YloU
MGVRRPVRHKRGGMVAQPFGGPTRGTGCGAVRAMCAGDRTREEDVARVTADPAPGRSLVTRRAVRELVRTATLSVYGVSGFAGGGPVGRLMERLGLGQPGLHLELGDGLSLDLQLTVAYGLPIAEVARQVESAVRYTLGHAIGREPDRVSIRIGHLRHEHGIAPGHEPAADHEPRPSDLAASGTDVA